MAACGFTHALAIIAVFLRHFCIRGTQYFCLCFVAVPSHGAFFETEYGTQQFRPQRMLRPLEPLIDTCLLEGEAYA